MFTKRLGTGTISTALKRGIASAEHVEGAVQSMLTLNRAACEAMLSFDIHGCTDVSGFGLLGHGRELALGSQVTLEIDVARLKLLAGALEYAEAGAISGGARNNREFASSCVVARRTLPEALEWLLYDPQTSGGLLFTLPAADADALTQIHPAALPIGRVVASAEKPIILI